MIAVGSDEFAQEFLRSSFRVAVGRVQKVSASRGIGIKDLFAKVAVGAPFPFGAKAHGAQAQFRDAQAGLAKEFVVHVWLIVDGYWLIAVRPIKDNIGQKSLFGYQIGIK